MRVRVVDYVANEGGGVRFASEMIRALAGAGAAIEVVSHGGALERYRAAVGDQASVSFVDLRFENRREWAPRGKQTTPVVGALYRAIGRYGRFHYRVPARALEGCDVAWFPWVQRHRLPATAAVPVVGSLHDLILVELRRFFPRYMVEDEAETLRRWCASDARVVVSSEATAAALGRVLGVRRARLDVVPLAGKHAAAAGAADRAAPPVGDGPFLLCPANLSPHKNHEVLLEGFARWGARWPLVLTGSGTKLDLDTGRFGEVKALIARNGLRFGETVQGLGYIDDARYYALLRRSRALIMPTLAEGGGSFPVWEALFEGIPVVCSDIPVMREMMERVGGEVLWFDPADPAELAARLDELEKEYPRLRARAEQQVPNLRDRSWSDVALEYRAILQAAAR